MKFRKRLLIALSVLLLISSSVILLRQPLLDFVIKKAQEKIKLRYGATLIVGDAGFLGFRDVYVKNVILIPPDGKDTLFTLGSLKARIRVGKLLRMKLGFREIVVDSVLLNLVKVDSLQNNYSFLFKKHSNADTTIVENLDGYNDRFKMLFGKVNDIFNENITVRQVVVNYQNSEVKEMIKIKV